MAIKNCLCIYAKRSSSIRTLVCSKWAQLNHYLTKLDSNYQVLIRLHAHLKIVFVSFCKNGLIFVFVFFFLVRRLEFNECRRQSIENWAHIMLQFYTIPQFLLQCQTSPWMCVCRKSVENISIQISICIGTKDYKANRFTANYYLQ